jgi:hypothetical protein
MVETQLVFPAQYQVLLMVVEAVDQVGKEQTQRLLPALVEMAVVLQRLLCQVHQLNTLVGAVVQHFKIQQPEVLVEEHQRLLIKVGLEMDLLIPQAQ